MKRPLIGALACALASTAASFAPAAHATDMLASEPAVNRVIYVPKDKTLAFRLDQPATKIVVAQADIAQVIATGDRSFYVRGRALGATNLLVYGAGGRLSEVIDIRVGYDPVELEDELAAAFPREQIHVRNLGGELMLQGEVSNIGVVDQVKALAERYAPQAVNSQLTARGTQVVLEVRVLEANRSLIHDIGLSALIKNNSFTFAYGLGLVGSNPANTTLQLTGGSGNTNIDLRLDALESKGLIRTLAKPNLVAMSGEKASFLAGGEFPYPVPQGLNNVTIDFRQYGVKLTFLPVVEENGLIRLQVEPEVSQIDQANSLKLSGINVPALTTRRAHTTVELKNGDSLAIGGLFQHNYSNGVSQVPGLGDIPILSALFRSTRWQRDETELVIVVTPHLATPADFEAGRQAALSGETPTPAQLMLHGKSLDKPLIAPNEMK